MNHKVFISHSSKDKEIANAICHYLEDDGIRCWIAPRDIDASDWAGSIMKGIQACDVFVVILSENSIPSPEVTKEVTEATRVCQYILPFKVDEKMLNDRLRYHLAPCHWLDAVNPPLEKHIQELIHRIHHLSGEEPIYQNTNRLKLMNTTVLPKSFFVGRDDEIAMVHQMLQEEHVLFLQGMGGIGKSEIAKGYAKTYADNYDTILFANYRSSILDMIIGDDIEIQNFKQNLSYGEDAESNEAFFKRKLKTLKELATDKTLLIVDNFDVEYDEELENLISGPYHILFTTRYEHYDYPSLPVGPIQDFETVYKLFAKHYGRPVPPKDKPIVTDILNLVHCHTITIELIAKQMRASFMPPAKMLQMLQDGGMNSGLKENVKRGSSGQNAFAFIKSLFNLSALSEKELYIMKCMCLVPHSGIMVNTFGDILELESFDVINELIAKSWLMLDEETYYLKMHPIIYDVVKDQLKPAQTNCPQYIIGLWNMTKNAWWHTLEERNAYWPLVDHILRYYSEPTEELFQQYSDFANLAWICSHFSLSIEASKRVYHFTLNHFGDAGYKPCTSARTVAGSYFNSGNNADADPYYFLALEHMLKNPSEDYIELGTIYQKCGRCAYQKHDFETSELYLNRSLEAFENAVKAGEAMESIAPVDTYIDFGRMYMEMGDYEKALTYAQKSYDMLYAWKNCEVTSSVYALNDMGICHSNLGDYEKADEYLQRALELNIQFNGEASMLTVRAKESIADNLAKQGKIEEAKRAYLELELEMEKNFGEECPACIRLKEKGEKLNSFSA